MGTAYGNEVIFTTLVNPDLPTLTTTSVTDITYNSSTSGGNITDPGISDVTARGVCWNTTGAPTISDSITTDGAGIGAYTSYITGLTVFTTYYVRAYATNSAGTAYGNGVSFTTVNEPCPAGPTVSYGGQTYNTLLIGAQCWLKENLSTSTYRNGDPIPNVTDEVAWRELATGAYCWYGNDSVAHDSTYGKLYNGFAVKDNRSLCPTGWHVPTDDEWTALTDYLGGAGVAGGKMKETGLTHWAYPNYGATNVSNYTALPGGMRPPGGWFGYHPYAAYIWSSSVYLPDPLGNWFRSLSNDNEVVAAGQADLNGGLSVRCIQD
jgi:uncharacterized protein (TIGR02145 family)